MSLAVGSRISAYEVTASLGKGGMGEVWRARDTKLGRDVAIKVLPASVAGDADRLARFTREAQVLAALNHPHIAAIYHVEETTDGPALVMELVEGADLSQRIAGAGAIALDEALAIARQVADALEAAHEQRIVHRDLKPANIKVRPDGAVKVLDFGLAKLAGGSGQQAVDGQAAVALTMSPTITSPAMMTGVGVLLGTAAYMSPEQAKGREADKRSDIWAFGCVLYEMLTGKRAFDGEDIVDVLGAVARLEPDWNALPSGLPPAVRILLRRCLQKDRRQRLGDMAAARLLIEEHATLGGGAAQAAPAPVRWPRRAVAAVSGLALVAAAFAGAALWPGTQTVEEAAPVRRFTLATDPAASILFTTTERNFALSPDGTRLAWVGPNRNLFVRRLDQQDPVEVSGTGEVRSPFFSPDSAWIGYFSYAGEIRKVSVNGGTPLRVWAGRGSAGRGAAWLPDDTIVFATADRSSGLLQVPSAGGEPKVLTTPNGKDELDHVWPEPIPGRHAVLFTVLPPGGVEGVQVASLDLTTGERKILVRGGSHAQYVRGGRLVYAVGDVVRAVSFEASGLEVTGNAVPVLEHVLAGGEGRTSVAVSNDGAVAYLSGTLGATQRSLTWVDRNGREEPIDATPRGYAVPRVSPDGTRIVSHLDDAQNQDIYVYDLARKTLLRLTYDPTPDIRPTWTPDGRWVLFQSNANGPGVYRKPGDGSGMPERIASLVGDGSPNVVSPDGKTVLFSRVDPSTGRDIWTVNLEGERTPKPLIAEPGNQGTAALSPDGRWVAYQDEAEGAIYVRPFPDVAAGRWQVAPAGAKWPLFSKDGRELFYLSTIGKGWALMDAAVDTAQGTFRWSTPKPLISFDRAWPGFGGVTGPRNYDLSQDGRRFLMIKDAASATPDASLVFIDNWFRTLNPAP